jgi:hypothetical protein
MLFRLIESFHKPLLLLPARNVQKEFEDNRTLSSEVILKVRNIGKSFVPDTIANKLRGYPLLP